VEVEQRAGADDDRVVVALDAELEDLAAAISLAHLAEHRARLREVGHRRPAPVLGHLDIGEDREQRVDVVRAQRPQRDARCGQRRHGKPARRRRNQGTLGGALADLLARRAHPF
jgi:hypothetical protein